MGAILPNKSYPDSDSFFFRGSGSANLRIFYVNMTIYLNFLKKLPT